MAEYSLHDFGYIMQKIKEKHGRHCDFSFNNNTLTSYHTYIEGDGGCGIENHDNSEDAYNRFKNFLAIEDINSRALEEEIDIAAVDLREAEENYYKLIEKYEKLYVWKNK